jgi:hypothetical protein
MCFTPASSSILHRIKVLDELDGGRGYFSWIFKGITYAAEKYVM